MYKKNKRKKLLTRAKYTLDILPYSGSVCC